MWLHSLKVAHLLRSATFLHTNQSRSYLNHLVRTSGSDWLEGWMKSRIVIGQREGEKHLVALLRIETRYIYFPARTLITTRTELHRVLPNFTSRPFTSLNEIYFFMLEKFSGNIKSFTVIYFSYNLCRMSGVFETTLLKQIIFQAFSFTSLS